MNIKCKWATLTNNRSVNTLYNDSNNERMREANGWGARGSKKKQKRSRKKWATHTHIHNYISICRVIFTQNAKNRVKRSEQKRREVRSTVTALTKCNGQSGKNMDGKETNKNHSSNSTQQPNRKTNGKSSRYSYKNEITTINVEWTRTIKHLDIKHLCALNHCLRISKWTFLVRSVCHSFCVCVLWFCAYLLSFILNSRSRSFCIHSFFLICVVLFWIGHVHQLWMQKKVYKRDKEHQQQQQQQR